MNILRLDTLDSSDTIRGSGNFVGVRRTMGKKMVTCAKYGEELPGLDAPPFDGELGQTIFEKVSARAWEEWQGDMMIKVINEYRLNLADSDNYNVLLQQMQAFLGLSSEQVAEVENEQRGKES